MIIFVANIPFKSRKNDLEDLFKQYGTVTRAYIIYDKARRRSKGYGFVEMPNDEEAKEAMDKLNGFELKDKKLVVTESTSAKNNSSSDVTENE